MQKTSKDSTTNWISAVQSEAKHAYFSGMKTITWKTRVWLLWQALSFRARGFSYSGYFGLGEVRVKGWLHEDGRVFITQLRRY